MKKSLIVFLVLVLIFATACGGSSNSYDGYASSTAAATAPPAQYNKSTGGEMIYEEESEAKITLDSSDDVYDNDESSVTDSGGNKVLANRKIIKYSHFDMETLTFDEDYADILALINSVEGYIESESVYGGQTFSDDYQEMHHAEIHARIPAERLDGVNSALAQIASVIRNSVSMDDITDTYFDSESRLNALEIQETRLLELLLLAADIEDIIVIEAKLAEVRYQIESLSASLGRMDSQVAYSYLTIYLDEVVKYQPQVSTFTMRISNAFSDSYDNITGTAEGLLIFIIAELPTLLIYAAFIGIIALIVIKTNKLFRKKWPKQPRKYIQNPNAQPVNQPPSEQPLNTEQPQSFIDDKYKQK